MKDTLVRLDGTIPVVSTRLSTSLSVPKRMGSLY